MRYALLIYAPSDVAATVDPAIAVATVAAPSALHGEQPNEWVAYTRALKAAGALVALERLETVETATSVRLRDGERLVTDGPFIETKEQLLGFFLIEAPDLDAALDWAARMPLASQGVVEVRPVTPQPRLAAIVAE